MTENSSSHTSAPSPSTSSAGIPATARGFQPATSDAPPARSLSSEPTSGTSTSILRERLPPLRTIQNIGPRQSAVHSILNPLEESATSGLPSGSRQLPTASSRESFQSSHGHESDQAGSEERHRQHQQGIRHTEDLSAHRASFSSIGTRAITSDDDLYYHAHVRETPRSGESPWASRAYPLSSLDRQRSVSSPHLVAGGPFPYESHSTIPGSQRDERRRSSERSEALSGPSSAHEATAGSQYGLTLQTAPGQIEGVSSYPMMTLQTDHGPYSVPIDVQAASRVADEKRKRNAGASARFRARRKEKEFASTKEIDDLKREISMLSNEVEFYRRERDALAPAVYNGPERDRYFPRPPSPRRQQLIANPRQQSRQQQSSTSRPPATAESFVGPNLYQSEGERGSVGRITRRRLSKDLLQAESPSSPYQSTPSDPCAIAPEQPGGDTRQAWPAQSTGQPREAPLGSQSRSAHSRYERSRSPRDPRSGTRRGSWSPRPP